MITRQSPNARGFQPSLKPGSGNTRLNLPTSNHQAKKSGNAKTSELTVTKSVSVTDSKIHVHVDYLRLIGNCIKESAFNDLLISVGNGKEFVHYSDGSYALGKGCKRYENMAITTEYVKVLYTRNVDPLTNAIDYDYTVDISGTTLEQWDTVKVWRLCMQLSHESYNGKWSRFDIAIDDYQRKFNLIKHCMDAIRKGQNIGFTKWGLYETGNGTKTTGETLYLGNRESKRFTRIYDAKAKHDIDATRFETELKGEYAKYTVKEFINEGLSKRECMDALEPMNDEQLNAHLSQWLGMVAISHVGFKDKSKQRANGQVSDLPDLSFWAWFKGRVGGTHKIVIPKQITTIEKTRAWIEKQVSKPLTRLKVAVGVKAFDSWLRDVLAQGFERLDRFDELQIQDYRLAHPVMS